MMRVIIADDEEKVCLLLCNLVDWKSLNMEIVGVAHNGIEALSLVKEKAPDLIVTDIRMPGGDGLKLIEEAKGMKEDLEIIIISGHSNFEYAKNAMKYGVRDYLLKPIKKDEFLYILNKARERHLVKTNQIAKEQELKTRLRKDIDKMRAGIFTEWLLVEDYNEKEMDINQINSDYHFNFSQGYFQGIAIKIDYQSIEKDEISILYEKITQIIEKRFKDTCQEKEIYCENSIVYCVLNFKTEQKEEIRHQIKITLDELLVQRTLFTQYVFTVGVGSVVDKFDRLKNSFKESQVAIQNRIVEGTGIIIQYTADNIIPKEYNRLLIGFDKNLKQAIEILNKESVLSVINDLEESVYQEKNITGQEVFFLVSHIYEMYLFYLANLQMAGKDKFGTSEEFKKFAERYGSTKELFVFLSKTINDSLDLIIKDKKQEDSKPIRKAKEYIQQNYKSSLTLEEVGNHIGLNATYFSSIFKKECGINFIEYIMNVRMEKAKELLRETNLNISTICEEVGYVDLKSFTKCFKKNAGVKPNEYRKLYS